MFTGGTIWVLTHGHMYLTNYKNSLAQSESIFQPFSFPDLVHIGKSGSFPNGVNSGFARLGPQGLLAHTGLDFRKRPGRLRHMRFPAQVQETPKQGLPCFFDPPTLQREGGVKTKEKSWFQENGRGKSPFSLVLCCGF